MPSTTSENGEDDEIDILVHICTSSEQPAHSEDHAACMNVLKLHLLASQHYDH